MRDRRPRHNNRDRLPKGLRNRSFKGYEHSSDKFGEQGHAVNSACDFAWCDPRVRVHLRTWLEHHAGRHYRTPPEYAGEYLSFELRTGHGVTVRAIFKRDTRLVGELLLTVAIDPQAPKMVYCGIQNLLPPPLLAATLVVVRV